MVVHFLCPLATLYRCSPYNHTLFSLSAYMLRQLHNSHENIVWQFALAFSVPYCQTGLFPYHIVKLALIAYIKHDSGIFKYSFGYGFLQEWRNTGWAIPMAKKCASFHLREINCHVCISTFCKGQDYRKILTYCCTKFVFSVYIC